MDYDTWRAGVMFFGMSEGERLKMAFEAGSQAGRLAGFAEAREAVEGEHLESPTDSADDIAYDLALNHAIEAIRALEPKSTHIPATCIDSEGN